MTKYVDVLPSYIALSFLNPMDALGVVCHSGTC